jgi:probable phosphoglycerate mutase
LNIYLIRHGEAAEHWHKADDPGLSELGRQQAAETAEKLLPQLGPDVRLISSPMVRARETAQPLADALGITPTIIEPFREITTPVDRADRHEWLRTIALQDWQQQHAMVQDWRTALLAELGKVREHAVIFTHFMVLNAIVGSLQQRDRVVCFLPANASVTTLKWSGDSHELIELGHQLKTKVN